MLGYDHDSFWDQTPRTLSLTFQAYNEKLVTENIWLAWHTAALQRAKKLPQLQSLMPRKHGPENWQQQLDGLKKWVQASGGKVIYKQ